ncbi:stage V sporulation protein AD [Bacillus sp. 1P06AnD]|uniref:stage V sporulation protein AD n=1 Tax=Bacillus sp. 1P06AnD TaxID=3132208 RepID=UPI0039A0A974
MLFGKQSWSFANAPVILATGVTGGTYEAEGPLASDFDLLYKDDYANEESHEKAHRKLLEDAVEIALKKETVSKEEIQFFIGGDLINQMTPTSFALRKVGIPTMGVYGACATAMEGLALAAFIVNHKGAENILTGASSHKGAVEKQFRYPNEYGGQKPPTSQRTVTGAGVALVSAKKEQGISYPTLESATIGKVIDMGLSDPYNMGGAMAPAAVDTIMAHHRDLGLGPNYYDAVITGDLGSNGRTIAYDLFQEKGFLIEEQRFMDCGTMIFSKDQQVFAGASGAGCSATVLYGHLLNEMKKGTYRRILLVSTGALLSPLTFQQNESIPCTAHAVAIHFR